MILIIIYVYLMALFQTQIRLQLDVQIKSIIFIGFDLFHHLKFKKKLNYYKNFYI